MIFFYTGYATVFSFMVSFFWMNVICFDIWYTFRYNYVAFVIKLVE